MQAKAYLYVITERFPKSGTLRLNENQPQFVCATETEAQFILKDLQRLGSGSGDPVLYEYFKVPFISINERMMQEA